MYGKYAKIQIRSMLQYKFNTFVLIISSIIATLADFLSIYVLFSQFKSVAGWGFYESSLMFGMVTMIFSSVECFARGYDEFSSVIRSGDLDRLLVRPIGIPRQLFYHKIEFTKLSRVLFGLVVTIFSIVNLNIVWTLPKVLVLIASVVCGCAVIFGAMLIAAGTCVFTIEQSEMSNIITNGSKELCYYPINVYNKWLARFFTFVIPLACFNYLPLSYIMGTGNLPQVVYALSPLFGIIFVIPCFIFFKWCLKHYQSTGT